MTLVELKGCCYFSYMWFSFFPPFYVYFPSSCCWWNRQQGSSWATHAFVYLYLSPPFIEDRCQVFPPKKSFVSRQNWRFSPTQLGRRTTGPPAAGRSGWTNPVWRGKEADFLFPPKLTFDAYAACRRGSMSISSVVEQRTNAQTPSSFCSYFLSLKLSGHIPRWSH